MQDEFVMHPGDRFVATKCGCSFTTDSGPRDASMAMQAPRCCCGHEMVKQGANSDRAYLPLSGGDESEERLEVSASGGAPTAMPD